MKGLFIKDLKLLKTQKNFLVLLLVCTVVLTFSSPDISFVLGYLSFIGIILAMSTFSYDEMDNGNAFLFSLPVSRAAYVREKYLFSLFINVSFWLFGLLLTFLFIATGKMAFTEELIPTAFLLLLITFIMLSFILPLYLKFGGEKARLASAAFFLGLLAIIFIFDTLSRTLHLNLRPAEILLENMNPAIIAAAALTVSAAFLFISYHISVKIAEKKEF